MLACPADMTYAQAADPAGAYPGMLSKGFLFAARVLWPALEQVLLAEVVQGSVRDVTVAGHSLGAAMATMLSYRAQVGNGAHICMPLLTHDGLPRCYLLLSWQTATLKMLCNGGS